MTSSRDCIRYERLFAAYFVRIRVTFIILFGIKQLDKVWKKPLKLLINCHVSWNNFRKTWKNYF